MFRVLGTDKRTRARRGVLRTVHGCLQTPFFMPVGTNGTVKSVTVEHLKGIGAQIVLSNTYHLYLRPGLEVLQTSGGLHGLMGWNQPILTDSGGYQVFSLSGLRKLKNDGVEFQSHLDGSRHFFTPEKVLDIQRTIGSDMVMPLDVCAPYPCDRQEAELSVASTTRWARRSREHFRHKAYQDRQALFGIVQGSVYQDLRQRSAGEITALDFDGYAIGGVSVGEPVEEMFKAIEWTMPFLPQDRPRYVMGIGMPDQIVKAVGKGVDMFDTCVPTRYGRHGAAFTRQGRINLMNAVYKNDLSPIDDQCACFVCRSHHRAYIRHLIKARETTGLTLVSCHNLYFYMDLMRRIREAIDQEQYAAFQQDFLRRYGSDLKEPEGVAHETGGSI